MASTRHYVGPYSTIGLLCASHYWPQLWAFWIWAAQNLWTFIRSMSEFWAINPSVPELWTFCCIWIWVWWTGVGSGSRPYVFHKLIIHWFFYILKNRENMSIWELNRWLKSDSSAKPWTLHMGVQWKREAEGSTLPPCLDLPGPPK